ncbi:MAG TPA: LEPR-XLL domain-containing protein [Gemmataceae bacterium]|jgi:hypothetical protein
MGTRRRDAERRQASLAVEALEDRFLLSGAVSHSTPAATNEHSALFAAAHNGAVMSETASRSPQAALDKSSALQNPDVAAKDILNVNSARLVLNAPVKPIIGYQREMDVDEDDAPGRTERDAPRNGPLVFPLSAYGCNEAMPSLDCPLPSRSPAQAMLPAANLMSFLPVLSASGLGAAKMASLSPAIAISENTSGNHDPAPSKDERRPMPAVPQVPPTPLSPKVAESAEPPPSSVIRPLAELLPIDVEAIQQGVDAFFQELGDLSEEWREGRVFEELAPWLLAASLAGYGWIRLRDHRDRRLADLLGMDRPEAAPPVFIPGGEG